jgi:hypothetical protein
MLNKIKSLINILIVGLFFSVSMPACAAGEITFTIKHDGNKDHERYAKYVDEKGTFKKIINSLNATLDIPYNINIILGTSDKGVSFDDKTKSGTLDYDDIVWSGDQYDKFYPNPTKESRQYFLNNINLFNLYYVLGHALIPAYKINIGDEDIDQASFEFTVVMLLHYFTHGDQILLDTAFYYERYSKEEDKTADPYRDTDTWAYQSLCYAYAKSPEYVMAQLKQDDKNKTLISFLETKQDSCVEDYKALDDKWMALLKPHFKTGKDADKATQDMNTTQDNSDKATDADNNKGTDADNNKGTDADNNKGTDADNNKGTDADNNKGTDADEDSDEDTDEDSDEDSDEE